MGEFSQGQNNLLVDALDRDEPLLRKSAARNPRSSTRATER
jgi:hypothetical protein